VLVGLDITCGVLVGEGEFVGEGLGTGVLVRVDLGVGVRVGTGDGLVVGVSVSLGRGLAARRVGRGAGVSDGEADGDGLATAATSVGPSARLAAFSGSTPWCTSRLTTTIRARIMARDEMLAVLWSCRSRARCSCCRNAPDTRGLFSLKQTSQSLFPPRSKSGRRSL
jgi:hypothetical protein